MGALDRFGRIDFDSDTADPALSTAPLFGEGRGQMFGILVCDGAVLKAFSGQYEGRWEAAGWAPPLLDPAEFRAAVGAADPRIKRLTAEINTLPPGADTRRSLEDERRSLSQRHMREIHEMYRIPNFRGQHTDLFTLFGDRPGIPAGTGDCCAPKLLGRAAALGLKPLSLAEFYWGRENRSGTKKHGRFYPPCGEKCRPILGYMLCGGVPGEDGADDD